MYERPGGKEQTARFRCSFKRILLQDDGSLGVAPFLLKEIENDKRSCHRSWTCVSGFVGSVERTFNKGSWQQLIRYMLSIWTVLRGSRYQNIKDLGPKSHNNHGL